MIEIKSTITRITAAVMCVALHSLVSLAQEAEPKDAPAKVATEKLAAGDHLRTLIVDQRKRTAIVHVPPKYNPAVPTPVVIALHGAIMTGEMMISFTGLSETADAKDFVVVYPNGTGVGPLQTWNAGGFVSKVGSQADDIAFLKSLLDDIESVVNVDPKRVYVTGMSNGGMMSYRLAAELSDRIAAIAPVGGTMPVSDAHPVRPVSVIHFHGTADTLVPYEIVKGKRAPLLNVKSVEDSVRSWAILDGCNERPQHIEVISKDGDELKVTRTDYGPGNEGSEVVLITIEGGGHTWPGRKPPVKFIGKAAMNISANELMWSFFEKHPMK